MPQKKAVELDKVSEQAREPMVVLDLVQLMEELVDMEVQSPMSVER